MDFPLNTSAQLSPVLRGFRKQAGLTQAEVALRIGTTQQTYARIEADPSTTSVGRFLAILQAIGAGMALQVAGSSTRPISRPRKSNTVHAQPKAGSMPSAKADGPGHSTPTKAMAAPAKLTPPSGKKEDW
ncbi:helix-turn-helix transcriptional regulator [Massilia sp. 9096]|uniref:helix-turn-helix domain-containing protein n=1 Tax=Massilia sp. 9096 TaxID=1500894 RepID=UPI0009DFEEB8